MGCLPLPLLFLLGFGLGFAIAGSDGALWGAGIGLLAGLAAAGRFITALRARQRR